MWNSQITAILVVLKCKENTTLIHAQVIFIPWVIHPHEGLFLDIGKVTQWIIFTSCEKSVANILTIANNVRESLATENHTNGY